MVTYIYLYEVIFDKQEMYVLLAFEEQTLTALLIFIKKAKFYICYFLKKEVNWSSNRDIGLYSAFLIITKTSKFANWFYFCINVFLTYYVFVNL